MLFPSNSEQGGYGYSILAEDFNGDGWYDLVVGVPFFTEPIDPIANRGSVCLYINNKSKNRSLRTKMVISGGSSGGYFGMALSRIGDINRDGYNGE